MATLKNLQKTAGKLSSIANTRLPDVQGVVAASADGNIRLGNFGDISFTSVRKSIPVLHGAYLQINNNFNLNKISKVNSTMKLLYLLL